VAGRVGIEPAYLSKIERGEMPPPEEETIIRLADELGEDRDVRLALAARVSSALRDIAAEAVCRATPRVAEGLRSRRLRIVRRVGNGNW
jgi:transcriptional regulator with XRE-family HTH domain